MSETAKTLAFMAAGAIALLAAFAVVPSQNTFDTNELVGQRLNQFEPEDAKRLKIVKFDAETAKPREFEVAEENGLWIIPSKQGYPADATKQMAAAANCLVDKEILRIASTSRSDHAALGVVDPSAAKLNSEGAGVGTRVIMSDNSNKLLTDMVVGKAVKDSEGQHYVRNTQQDIVYVVKMDPKELTTRFEDWIEGDLLKISPFDIRHVDIKDYTAELMLTLQGSIQARWEPRAEMTLAYSDTDSKWSADSLKKFNKADKKYEAFAIPDGEEINEEALNKMRDGLDDLTIVDVERKPAGLSAELKAGEDFLKDIEAIDNLMARGFAPIGSADNKQTDILSTEGEVVCSLQDGVEYVLRFGNLQMEGEDGSKPIDDAAEEAAAKKSDEAINRYLFVMARFNEGLLKKPELDELPELPAEEETPEETTEEGETASETEASEAETPETEAGEPASEGGDAESPEDAEAKAEERADIIAARKEIEQENQRRLDEHQEKIKKAKEQVAVLNERFGDWYYVISNDVFQQVHLGLDKVVMKKEEKKDDAAGAQVPAGGIPGLPNLPFGAPPAQQ